MKKKRMKKIALALAFAAVITLAGCSQPEEASSSQESQSSIASAAVSSSSQNRQEPSADEVEPAQAASAASDESGVNSGADSGSSAPGVSVSGASMTDAPTSAAPEAATPEQVSGESQAVPGGQALSGIDLNVRFGDGGAPFALHLYDNETADAIARHVGTADWRLPIYHYDDYEGWEVMQYYDIPSRYEIPSNPQGVTSEKMGEVYYSEPNRMILFYGDAEIPNEYTPVGYIDASEDFMDAVENNPVLEGWGNKIVNISR